MPAPVLETALTGHLDLAQLEAKLAIVAEQIQASQERPGVLLDCTQMTSYDLAAREAFVGWNTEHCEHVTGLAIIIRRPMWFAVVATMSLLSRQEMRAFKSPQDGTDWLARL